MAGIIDDIYERIYQEYGNWMRSKRQPKWFSATNSLQLVSKLKENGGLVKAFEEVQDGRKKWKNHPSELEKFVSRHAQRLFLVLVYSKTLPLIDQFCTHKIGDELFARVIPKWEGSHVTFDEKPDVKLEIDNKNLSSVHYLLSTCRPDFFVRRLDWTDFNSPPLPSNCILPFLGSHKSISETDFSTVFEYVVHKSHIKFESEHLDILTNKEGHPHVALKILKISGLTRIDYETFIKSEHKALDTLRKAKSQHLIKALAFYRTEDGQFNFVLPFAQHGNLRKFWGDKNPLINDTNYMKWVFEQIAGLAGAVREMHGEGSEQFCRHGDLKPENILCFQSKKASITKDQTSCVLVIADVGISRTHNEVTELRTRTKLAKADTIVYAAPETELWPDNATSRRADIWALGCLFLEFMIWLLYKNDGLVRFSKDLGKNGKFYTTIEGPATTLQAPGRAVPERVAIVNPKVKDWIHKLKNDPSCVGTGTKKTALGRLLVLIEERMLNPIATPDRNNPSSEPSNGTLVRVDSAYDGGTAEAGSGMRQGHPQFAVALRSPTFPVDSNSGGTENLSNERAYAKEVCADLRAILRVLSLCTLPQPYDTNENLESGVRLGYPTLSNVSSPLHTQLLRGWLWNCDTTHKCLASPEKSSFLPTRLLDVGKRGSTRTRLICNTAKLDAQKVKYLALSHRWGPPRVTGESNSRWDKFVCTFKTNIGEIEKGKEDSAFPEKYQDAISVARRLEVRYLWIDSLCIIQEDKNNPEDEDKGQDFKKEAEHMEMVFRSAYATLAASCSNSSEEHFLKLREKKASVTMQAGKALYYLSDAIDDFYGDVEQGALNKRGWVFQERALSRRTIHFTETQTYWECGEGVRCETLMKAKSPNPSFLSDAHFPSSLLKYGAGKSFELYQDLYERYSRLALSNTTDRPVAIRGLETRLLSVLGTAGGYGVFENDLCRGLLWQREEASIGSIDFSVAGKAQNTVPSWSWMAYAGPIHYINVPFDWAPRSEEITSPWKADKRTSKAELHCCARDMHDIEPGVQIFLDDSGRTFGSSFKCVVLGSSKMPDGSDKCYALIIIPAGKGPGEEDIYVRAGVASLMHRHIVWDSCAKVRLL